MSLYTYMLFACSFLFFGIYVHNTADMSVIFMQYLFLKIQSHAEEINFLRISFLFAVNLCKNLWGQSCSNKLMMKHKRDLIC